MTARHPVPAPAHDDQLLAGGGPRGGGMLPTPVDDLHRDEDGR